MLFIKKSTNMANLLKNRVVQQLQHVRCLPRWQQRTTRVTAAEDYAKSTDSITLSEPVSEDKDFNQNTEQSLQKTSAKGEKSTQEPLSTISHLKGIQKKSVEGLSVSFDKDGNVVYTKMGNNDIRISRLMALAKSSNMKEKKKLMLLEGKILIREALQSGCNLQYLLFSRLKEVECLKNFLPCKDVQIYKLPYKEIQSWSDLTMCPGIMGIFQIPDTESYKPIDPLPITVICDNVREPSNLGSILRICSGVGCENLILTKGCVNAWNTKVLRTGSGAHFKLHIVNKTNWSDIIAALPDNYSLFIADNNVERLSGGTDKSIPVLPYYSVNFKMSKHIVLILGGETHGISPESYALAEEKKGIRLNIPLHNDLDSLNTSIALGIIIFEVKRQLSNLHTDNLHYDIRDICTNNL
ncbi:rRNA methyltransferase 3, mitochondrial [Sitophilus oryzae]|uniref:rRNA methyltransferase 3, mitochondrial n=1 Tax=Sitophilus oryzae TaxID=7048 RepID=A0A6J2XRF0_SITOR|nr:rRNA methyltransferase 3, mitochondrial [Sitophilus oryzae]